MKIIVFCATRRSYVNFMTALYLMSENRVNSCCCKSTIYKVANFKFKVDQLLKNTNVTTIKLDGNETCFVIDRNYLGIFTTDFSHLNILLMLVNRPIDLGGLVGECNNIRGESELRGDSSSVSTPCAMWGGL